MDKSTTLDKLDQRVNFDKSDELDTLSWVMLRILDKSDKLDTLDKSDK